MVETLGDFLIKAYNANERGNHYEVKKNLKVAIKMLRKKDKTSSRKSDVIDTMHTYT